MGKDYKVGHGRPPEHTRFKKGKSGNPSGRPKKAPPQNEGLDQLLDRLVPIRIGGVEVKLTAIDAMRAAMLDKAMKGDARAAAYIEKLEEKLRPRKATGESNRSVLVVWPRPRNAEEEDALEREIELQQAPFRGNQGEPPADDSEGR